MGDFELVWQIDNLASIVLSQPGFSRVVPRVLVSCISRLDTYPKCLPSNRMLNAPPGPVRYVVCVDGYIAPSRLRKIINK